MIEIIPKTTIMKRFKKNNTLIYVKVIYGEPNDY